MTEDKTPTQSAVEDLVAQLAADVDVELRAAVTRRLGRSTWSLDEIAGRLQVRHVHDEAAGFTSTIYFLDGLELLGVEPAEYDELGAAHLATNRSMVAGLKFSRYSPRKAPQP